MIIKKLSSVITSRIFYLILGIFLAAGFAAYATWDEARTGGSGQLTEANWNALVTMVEEEIGGASWSSEQTGCYEVYTGAWNTWVACNAGYVVTSVWFAGAGITHGHVLCCQIR